MINSTVKHQYKSLLMVLIGQSHVRHPEACVRGLTLIERCVLWLCGWLSVVESDDSPMQVETIDDPTVTHLTLKGLDRHSRYRFYLRGRTTAGDGEPIAMEGATTLDGGATAS